MPDTGKALMDNTDIIIMKIADEDVERIYELEKEIFPDPWGMIGISGSLRQDHTELLGAWHGDRLLGYVIACFSIYEGEIARIAVAKDHRRKGIAGRLLKELEQLCRRRGAESILLDVRESNQGAIAFYRSHGFTIDGIRRNFYTKPEEDAILMSRKVGK